MEIGSIMSVLSDAEGDVFSQPARSNRVCLMCGRWPHRVLSLSTAEGEKLIMTCHIFLRLISVFPLLRLLQGYLLAHNQQQGVIISNHSLVIQGVSRTTAGNYSCVGFNAEGQGTSPPFQLNVLCKCPSE